jgi:hypothetical protein
VPEGGLVGSCPPPMGLGSRNYYIFQNNSPKSFVQFREFFFLHKKNTMVVVLKTSQSGLLSFKSCKLESKTREKALGKIDTTDMY